MNRPDPDTLAAIVSLHERYVTDVVEALNLCPFSRRARERGEVERMTWPADEVRGDPARVAAAFARRALEHDGLAIGLLTFVTWGPEDPWRDPRAFDAFRRAVHAAYSADPARPSFHMVTFHPALALRPGAPLNPQTAVALLRRTPDPVIQCVRASVLDAIQAEGRERARAERADQLADVLATLPESMRAAIECSEVEDPVSASIARRNHELVSRTPARLEGPVGELIRAREALEE
jgi:hypothetical protein